MVAGFDHIQFGGWLEPLDDRPQLVGFAEWVARTLDEEHRRPHLG
jgi:hypothetical protein